jgi:hypothetical protein
MEYTGVTAPYLQPIDIFADTFQQNNKFEQPHRKLEH